MWVSIIPHQCVRCGKLYSEASNELLKGCGCGGKFFFFVRKEELDAAREITESLSMEDKQQMEEDVMELVGLHDPGQAVVLDLESIRIQKPGKYEISLVDLFSGKPLVFKVGDGKYVIDLAGSFGREKK